MASLKCDKCRGPTDRLRWCGEELGWACPACVEHPWNGALWRAWKALQAEHESERQRQRQVREEPRWLR